MLPDHLCLKAPEEHDDYNKDDSLYDTDYIPNYYPYDYSVVVRAMAPRPGFEFCATCQPDTNITLTPFLVRKFL